jgi:hypothetical protein
MMKLRVLSGCIGIAYCHFQADSLCHAGIGSKA